MELMLLSLLGLSCLHSFGFPLYPRLLLLVQTKKNHKVYFFLSFCCFSGMQGQLWSEIVRTSKDLHYMVFPRLLALAERAWHKAEWETVADADMRKSLLYDDWADFAYSLGHKELKRLDESGIKYRVPLPGAR